MTLRELESLLASQRQVISSMQALGAGITKHEIDTDCGANSGGRSFEACT